MTIDNRRHFSRLQAVQEQSSSQAAKDPPAMDLAAFQIFAAAVARMENRVPTPQPVEAPRAVKVSTLETLRAVEAPPSENESAEEPPQAVIARFPSRE
jgi:hypothetical protein